MLSMGSLSLSIICCSPRPNSAIVHMRRVHNRTTHYLRWQLALCIPLKWSFTWQSYKPSAIWNCSKARCGSPIWSFTMEMLGCGKTLLADAVANESCKLRSSTTSPLCNTRDPVHAWHQPRPWMGFEPTQPDSQMESINWFWDWMKASLLETQSALAKAKDDMVW